MYFGESNEEVNFILLHLIYNYFHKKHKKPSYHHVSGPYKLYYIIDRKTKKHIYMFGEKHKMTNIPIPNDAIPIHEYLNELFVNTDVFIDFFIEGSRRVIGKHRFNKIQTEEGYLTTLEDFFKICLDRDAKYFCYKNLVRAHTVDIRDHLDEYETNNDVLLMFKAHVCNSTGEKIKLTDIIKYKRLTKIFELSLTNLWIYYLPEQVKKELDRSYMKDNIILAVKKYIGEGYLDIDIIIFKEIKKFIIMIERQRKEMDDDEIIKMYLNEWTDYFEDISNASLNFLSLMMDIYTISRIYKKFKEVSCCPEEPKNIIIYQGGYHSKTLLYLLKELGCELINESDNILDSKGNVCGNHVKMDNIIQPLFNTYIM